MPIDESIERSPAGLLTLAVRRPGHAVMSHLLHELARGEHGTSVPPSLQSWYVGAEGEMLVGQELARLPSEWRVLHAVPVGREADIDHLVVGPPGVFVLNTKRHPGKRIRVGTHVVWINGSPTADYQNRVRDRALKVSAALDLDFQPDLVVEPLLVFVDAREVRHVDEQTVASVRMAGLVQFLLARPHRLTQEQVDAVFARASRPSTWGRSASVLHEPDPTARFLELRALMPDLPAPAKSTLRPVRRAPRHQQPAPRSATTLGCFGALVLALMTPMAALLGLGLLNYLLQALVVH